MTTPETYPHTHSTDSDTGAATSDNAPGPVSGAGGIPWTPWTRHDEAIAYIDELESDARSADTLGPAAEAVRTVQGPRWGLLDAIVDIYEAAAKQALIAGAPADLTSEIRNAAVQLGTFLHEHRALPDTIAEFAARQTGDM